MALRKCKECGEDISSDAKICPRCGKDQRNFFQKHTLLTIFLIFIGICTIGNLNMSTNNNSSTFNSNYSTNSSNYSSNSNSNSNNTSNIPLGKLNAVGKAKEYLYVSAFSYKGLIKQLEFEGFSSEEATYGADNCGANWNDQAARKAKEYLGVMSFSKSGLIQQLEFEGFTSEQAAYGVSAVGY